MSRTLDLNIVITPLMTGELAAPLYVTASGLTFGFSITGELLAPQYYDCEGAVYLPFPALQVKGSGYANVTGAAVFLQFPKLSVSGAGVLSAIGVGNITFPKLLVEASGSPSVIGKAEIIIPRFTIAAESLISANGTLSIILPALTVSGRGESGIDGSLDISFPALAVSGSGWVSVIGTGTIMLPVFSLSAASLPAAADYLSMVMNIKNRALTLFDNYAFNSLCRFGNVNLGASSTEIFDLDSGDTDDSGTEIDWNIRTGYLDLEQKTKKKIREAWLSYKTSGDLILTVIQPNGEQYEYGLRGIDITETGLRVKFGRGIRSRYVAIDVKNVDGSSISLDALKAILEKTDKSR